jgi:hypothetical protein
MKEDLRARTKAFALRIITMYSALPKSAAVSQVPGKQVLRSGTAVEEYIPLVWYNAPNFRQHRARTSAGGPMNG